MFNLKIKDDYGYIIICEIRAGSLNQVAATVTVSSEPILKVAHLIAIF